MILFEKVITYSYITANAARRIEMDYNREKPGGWYSVIWAV